MQSLVMDCDPGVDDAVALLLALAQPQVRVLAVTVVAGNVPADRGWHNARAILALAGREDIPVAKGADAPLVRPLRTATEVHGETGLGGVPLPEPRGPAEGRHAVDVLREVLAAATEPVTLVATGPLTNVALLLRIAPWVRERIARVVVMGGAIGLGNVTPAAEFNMYVDPEAAHAVLHSGLPITLVGLEVADAAQLTSAQVEELARLGRVGGMAAAWLRYYERFHRERGYAGVPLYDPTAVGEALWPGLVRTEKMAVTVETGTGLCAGRTLMSRHERPEGWAVLDVGTGIDGEAFFARLKEALARYP